MAQRRPAIGGNNACPSNVIMYFCVRLLALTYCVAVSVCGRFGLWLFQSVAVPVCGLSVCGRSGLWPSGLWPFRFVAVSICGRSGLWPFRFVAVSVVAVSVCGRYDLLPFTHIRQQCFTGTVAILRLLLCQWSNTGALQWRHNGCGSISNHQPHDCLLNRWYRRRSKKISQLRVTGICAGNSPVTGEFPAQMASNAENVSIWCRHHVTWVYRWHNATMN